MRVVRFVLILLFIIIITLNLSYALQASVTLNPEVDSYIQGEEVTASVWIYNNEGSEITICSLSVYIDDNEVGYLDLCWYDEIGVAHCDYTIKPGQEDVFSIDFIIPYLESGFYKLYISAYYGSFGHCDTVEPIVETNIKIISGSQIITSTGILYIYSNPSGAEVYIDGIYYGTTPLTVEIEEGFHDIEFLLSGYERKAISISLKAGETREISVELVPLKREEKHTKCFIEVSSIPSDANVYIDGVYVGITPLKKDVLCEKKYNIKIKKEGFEIYEEIVEVNEQNPTYKITANLVKKEVKEEKTSEEKLKKEVKCVIDISSSPSDAEVYIDGKFVGKTPFKDKFECKTYLIEVKKEGYEPWRGKAELSPDNPIYKEHSITLTESKKLEFGGYNIDKKYLAIIPVVLGILGFLIRLLRGS